MFSADATADSGTFLCEGGEVGSAGAGFIIFSEGSTASNGTFTTNAAEVSLGGPGTIHFLGTSTAANGAFINNASGVTGANGGTTNFFEGSTAGIGSFTINGGSVKDAFGAFMGFFDTSNAGNATLVINGGTNGGEGGRVVFFGDSTGSAARIEPFGNGNLELSLHNAPGVTIGSLEGSGVVFLGANRLTIGSNNLDTEFSGIMQDGGAGGGADGSMTKIGTGTLTLSGASSYTGPTIIEAGKLTVTGSIFSAVTVNSGATLGGSGMTGSVTVKPGGKVVPGDPQTLTVEGDYEQDATATLHLDIAGTDSGAFDQLVITGNAMLLAGSVLELNFLNGFAPQAGDTFDLLTAASVTGDFGTVDIEGLEPGFQYTLAIDGNGHLTLTALNDGVSTMPAPSNLLNISTRLQVLTEDNVLVGGLIITGNSPKRVILRAIGPSLVDSGLANTLADPVLELHLPDMTVVTNDNWKDDQQAEIEASTIPPTNDLESAIIATLAPGAYTAIVRGKDGGTGVGLIEAYDLDLAAASTLGNISTRGFVDTGDDVMIGGVILGGATGQVLVRAIGPELADQGVTGALEDTVLELYDKNGGTIATNDDWKDAQQAAIEATGVPPTDDRESAILMTLAPDSYTAIVRGKDGTTGVALVEVYSIAP